MPIISHALKAARETGLYDRIHVSTDSARIADVVAELGHPVAFMRPDELADDLTPILPVLKHVVETFAARGETFDQVSLIMACAPLIEASDLLEADKLFSVHEGTKSVAGVTAYPVPIEWAFDRGEDDALVPVQPGKFAVRSQDLAVRYYDVGAFTIIPVKFVLELDGAGDDSLNVAYVLPREKAVDIDDENDWRFAEALFRLRSNSEAH